MKKWVFISLVFILGIGSIGYLLSKHFEKQKREDEVWMARLVLEEMKSDKSFEYLRLDSIMYDGQNLQLTYQARHDILDVAEFVTDKVSSTNGKTTISGHTTFRVDSMSEDARSNLMWTEFASLIAFAPHKWDSIFSTLARTNTDLSVSFVNNSSRNTLRIPYDKMEEILKDQVLLSKGASHFMKRKKMEVLDYAKGHFRGDPYLHVDSLTLAEDFVSLYMSYDDSKYRMGKSYLDSKHINPHFIDPVGDMGSILDGMLTLCSMSGYGLEFVYVGKKKGQTERCQVKAENVKSLIQDQSNQIWIDGRKTNNVKTTIGRYKE